MTKEEAIEILNTYDMSEDNDDTEFKGAIALAIKALEQKPCEPVRNPDQLDCVNRQAVMDCYKKWQPYMATRLWEFEQELTALPSVSSSEKPNINEVLDKIRAEIDSHCSDNRDRNDGLYIAMKIIDKYMAEGSGEE